MPGVDTMPVQTPAQKSKTKNKWNKVFFLKLLTFQMSHFFFFNFLILLKPPKPTQVLRVNK